MMCPALTTRLYVRHMLVDNRGCGWLCLSHPFTHGHAQVLSNEFVNAPTVVGSLDGKAAPVAFQGVGQFLGENPLAMAVLSGSSTSYSAVPLWPIADFAEGYGTETVLVSAIQARNNARVVVSGSLYMFSDAAATKTVQRPTDAEPQATSNRVFAEVCARPHLLQHRESSHFSHTLCLCVLY